MSTMHVLEGDALKKYQKRFCDAANKRAAETAAEERRQELAEEQRRHQAEFEAANPDTPYW